VSKALPTGTVTFLLTDIEGSTRLLHRLGERYAGVLAAHREIMRSSAAAHGGAEVDTQGDAFFIAFGDAAECVRAAVEVQRKLAAHAWPPDGVVLVRMGIHTGEPTRTDEGYVGMDVHHAARICSSGHGGQILLSKRTASLVEAPLAAEQLMLRDLGEHRLKDLAEPQRLFQVVIPELPSDFSPIRTLETRPNNLPVPPTPFVGRAKEVAAVRDLLLRDDVRVVTLTGPGGTGKSRLGLRVATELLHSFKDGAFYVPLAPVRDAKLVPSAIARALGVREARGKTIVETLSEQLADKQLLLLIDNFEHVRAGARALAELMSHCPRVKVLLTSRQVLRLSGEREVPVLPLGLPERGRTPALAELRDYEAVRLFLDRAEAARPGLALDERSAGAIVDICRRLDGLPLAIELAAAQVRSLEPSALLAALESRLSVLVDGPIDLPERQQTLRDAIAWSYEMLEPDEQRAFRQLSVFVGGGNLEAIEEVCETGAPLDRVCNGLVETSLLNEIRGVRTSAEKVLPPREASHPPRFAMLETIREYASELLAASGEAAQVGARHRAWCMRLAETAEPQLRSPEAAAWMDELETEHDNLRAALASALAAQPVEGETALRIAAALVVFWYQHGHFSEARQWLDRALAIAEQAPPPVRAKALHGAAGMARHQGDEDAAVEYCETALALYREAGDRPGIARVLAELGAVLERRGDHDRAAQVLEESLALSRELGERERIAFALVMLGLLEEIRGNYAAGIERQSEALAIGRELDDKNTISAALLNLAGLHRLRGDDARAAALLRESLPIHREMRQPNAIAYCLEVLAGIETGRGRGSQAARLFGAADKLREEIGAPVESFNLEAYERDLAAARKLVEPAAFEAAWQAGRRLDAERAVEFALSEG